MNRQEFITEIFNLCPWISDKTIGLFDIYKDFVQQNNAKFNLSRLVSDELIYEQYFLSSLVPFVRLKNLNFNNDLTLLDIGTGSGIPGVVLKIIFPHLKLTLLEANKKKCVFLEALVAKLNFHDVKVINDRCENYIHGHYEEYDIVTSRAVASLNKILELSVGFVKVNGHIIALKSQQYEAELLQSQGAINLLSVKLLFIDDFQFFSHNLVTLDFVKQAKTNQIYPRKWTEIIKKPL